MRCCIFYLPLLSKFSSSYSHVLCIDDPLISSLMFEGYISVFVCFFFVYSGTLVYIHGQNILSRWRLAVPGAAEVEMAAAEALVAGEAEQDEPVAAGQSDSLERHRSHSQSTQDGSRKRMDTLDTGSFGT